MAPTLNAGDDILVDLGDFNAGRRVTVRSDNPAYPDWPDCDTDDIQCIDRVIWAGRKTS